MKVSELKLEDKNLFLPDLKNRDGKLLIYLNRSYSQKQLKTYKEEVISKYGDIELDIVRYDHKNIHLEPSVNSQFFKDRVEYTNRKAKALKEDNWPLD